MPIVGVIWGVTWWITGDTLEVKEDGKNGVIIAVISCILRFFIMVAMEGA